MPGKMHFCAAVDKTDMNILVKLYKELLGL